MSTKAQVVKVTETVLQGAGKSADDIAKIAAELGASVDNHLARQGKVAAWAGGDKALRQALEQLAQQPRAWDAIEGLAAGLRGTLFATFKSRPAVLTALGRLMHEAPAVRTLVEGMARTMPSQLERVLQTALLTRGKRGTNVLRAAADSLSEADLAAIGTEVAKQGGARAAAARFEALVAQRLAAKLPTGARRFAPAFVRYWHVFEGVPLDADAVKRIITKLRLPHRKGQLLEELLPGRIAKLRQTPEGRALLGIEGIDPNKVVFIPGHQIRDAGGRQITDGVLAVKEGDRLRIVTIFEAKAGQRASRGLKLSATRLEDLTPAERLELDMYARDILTDPKRTPVPGETLDDIKQQVLSTGGEGQIQRDLERLGTDEWTKIKIDGTETSVRVSRTETKFVGAIPNQVDLGDTETFLKGLGFRFGVLRFEATANEMAYAAQDLAKL